MIQTNPNHNTIAVSDLAQSTSISIYTVTFLLYLLLILLNRFVRYIFRQEDYKKKFLLRGGSQLISPSRWIGNKQFFKIGLGEGKLCLWKRFLFLSIHRLFHLDFRCDIYGKSVTRTYLGAFLWVPITFKRYQNTSGCGTDIFYSCTSFSEIFHQIRQVVFYSAIRDIHFFIFMFTYLNRL